MPDHGTGMVSSRPTIFLDFDGTITSRDATDAILEAFADPRWLQVEEAWKAGRLGSRECLTRQMGLVRASREEIDALLDGIGVDPAFARLLETCAARAVPLHIVSDGFDYCIERILQRPSLGLAPLMRNTRVVSSRLAPSGAHWAAGFAHFEGCAHGCATCKPTAMRELSAGGPAVFVGDGLSDRHAAAAADVVFAKEALAAYCGERAIAYHPFETLGEVHAHLQTLLEPAASWPQALPGKGHFAT